MRAISYQRPSVNDGGTSYQLPASVIINMSTCDHIYADALGSKKGTVAVLFGLELTAGGEREEGKRDNSRMSAKCTVGPGRCQAPIGYPRRCPCELFDHFISKF